MRKSKVIFVIYLSLNIALLIALTALHIAKAVNGYSVRDSLSPFLFAPIVACKLSAVGINLLYSLFLLISHRDRSFRQWSAFIPLFILLGFSADLMNALGNDIVFYVCFIVAYSIPFLFRKPKLIEGLIRLGIMIVAIVLAIMLTNFNQNVRLTVVVAGTLLVTVVFAAIYFAKNKSKYNFYLLAGALSALVSDAFLAAAYLTSNTLAVANIFSMLVWPTYLIEYIFLNVAFEKSLAVSEA